VSWNDVVVIKMCVLRMGASNLAAHLPQHFMLKVNDLIVQRCFLVWSVNQVLSHY